MLTYVYIFYLCTREQSRFNASEVLNYDTTTTWQQRCVSGHLVKDTPSATAACH